MISIHESAQDRPPLNRRNYNDLIAFLSVAREGSLPARRRGWVFRNRR